MQIGRRSGGHDGWQLQSSERGALRRWVTGCLLAGAALAGAAAPSLAFGGGGRALMHGTSEARAAVADWAPGY